MNSEPRGRSALSCSFLSLSLFLSLPAYATGYYNLGSHWKGGMNPYRLGADVIFQAGFTSGVGASVGGYDDGMSNNPNVIATDTSGNIYVADSTDRISKFSSAGAFQGWIGKILTSPTGGAAGCNGAAVGSATPGWCKGGTSTSGSGDGMLNGVTGIAIDSSGNIYVIEYDNNRVDKFNSAGVFQGWIGKIATSPTGGDAGCNGASVGSATPGWCKGGAAGLGSGDGMLNGPNGIALDSSGNIYVTDSNHRISKFNSSGVFQGWTGKISSSPTGGAAGCNGASGVTPGWCTGGTSNSGSGDGMLHTPRGITIDASGNIYVNDSNNFRLVKYNSSGVYQGWTGAVSSTPTGGAAGCSSAAAFSITPGWCSGGVSTTGLGTGALSLISSALTIDSAGKLYLADGNAQRISKWDAATGVGIGWIGLINLSPTGGDPGCAGASAGTLTPGWCSGGNAAGDSRDGAMNSPQSVDVDSSGNLYVADRNNNRVNRYDSAGVPSGALQSVAVFSPWHRTTASSYAGSSDAMLTTPSHIGGDSSKNLYVIDSGNHRVNKYSPTGAFIGWIGGISISPTGGAAGCIGATGATPGWCTGGEVEMFGQGDGMMYFPTSIAIGSSGTFYIADQQNHRILKYDSSGAFQGWIGYIGTSPTGGAAGCSGASTSTFTPGWCTGGTATSGTGDGAMNNPTGIVLDSSGNLYVTDYNNARINKYTSAGVFVGWIGKIAVSPTGGATGCSSAAVGTFTPGWCTGGSSTSGNGDGLLKNPYGIAIDSSGNIYVTDSGNHRINRYSSSGAFLGWTGLVATTPTGGAAGCSSASAGTLTPGWCTGGTGAAAGSTFLNTPTGIALDSNGSFYISDKLNHRVVKYNSLGAQQGWFGNIASSPTGGATGCKGAAAGSVTPGWCTGGTSSSGTSDGMMNKPMGLFIDSSGNLYIADQSNHRIIRVSTAGK